MWGGDVHDVDGGVGDQVGVRRVGVAVGAAVLLGEGLAEPVVRDPTAANRAPGTSRRSDAKLVAILPVARIPQPVVSAMPALFPGVAARANGRAWHGGPATARTAGTR